MRSKAIPHSPSGLKAAPATTAASLPQESQRRHTPPDQNHPHRHMTATTSHAAELPTNDRHSPLPHSSLPLYYLKRLMLIRPHSQKRRRVCLSIVHSRGTDPSKIIKR